MKIKYLTTVFFLFVLVKSYSQDLSAKQFFELTAKAQSKLDSSEWKEAITLYETIVKQNPVRGDYWMNLATARYQNKNYDAAIYAYQKALSLGFEFKWERAMDIAHCYAQLNKKDPCYLWMEKSLALGYPSIDPLKRDSVFIPFLKDSSFKKLLWLMDTKNMPRTEGWNYDLDYLWWQIQRVAFNPYRIFSKADFENEIKTIRANIPSSTEMQLTASFMKLIAMVGDGHSKLHANKENPELKRRLSCSFSFYKEGLYIVAADSANIGLIGNKVIAFDNISTDSVYKRLSPYISHDNELNLKFNLAYRMTFIQLLNAIGITREADRVELTIVDKTGKEKKVYLKTIIAPKGTAENFYYPEGWANIYSTSATTPLYIRNPEKNFWFEYLGDKKTVYFKFNNVFESDSDRLADFTKKLFGFIDNNDVNKLVIDIRDNGGGNTMLLPPLVHAIMKNDKVNQQGKLFCIIGRKTFSACQNFTTYLESFTNVIFVGEPTGSSPNFIGENNPFELPYSHLVGNISNLYWGVSYPYDNRTWTAPQIYVEPSISDVYSGSDAALESIFSF